MVTNEIDQILKKTLADFRLSRSERQALGKLLDELGAGRRQLDVFRQRAFAVAREELVGRRLSGRLWIVDRAADELLMAGSTAAAFFQSLVPCSGADHVDQR